MKVFLDCGCEVEVIGKSGSMSIPCSTHFGKHKVGLSDQPEEKKYRVGYDIGDGAFRYFSNLSAAESYWSEVINDQNDPDLVMQRCSVFQGKKAWVTL